MKKQLNKQVLKEFLARTGMDVPEFCQTMGISRKYFADILLNGIDTTDLKLYIIASIMNVSVFDLVKQ